MDINALEKVLNDVLKSPENEDLNAKYCDSIVEYINSNEQVDDVLPIVIEGIDIDRAANYFDYLESASNTSLKKLWKKLRNDESIKKANNVKVLKLLSGLLLLSFMEVGKLGNHFGSIMALIVGCINAHDNPIHDNVYGPILRDYIFDDLDPNSMLPDWETIKAFDNNSKEFAGIVLAATEGDNVKQYKLIREWASRGICFVDGKIEKEKKKKEALERNNIVREEIADSHNNENKTVQNDPTNVNPNINTTNANTDYNSNLSSNNADADNADADQKVSDTERTKKQTAVVKQSAQNLSVNENNKVSDADEKEKKNDSVTEKTVSIQYDKKADAKDDEATTISLKDRSELFNRILDIALTCEKLESDNKKLESSKKRLTAERKKLKEENSELNDLCGKLKEERTALIQQLKEWETRYQSKLEKIDQLQAEIAQRNEVITIVKADKDESAMEYKNALAASIKTSYTDFVELKGLGTKDDIALALIDTLENVFKTLDSNGIKMN